MKTLVFFLLLSSACSQAQNKWEATIQAFEQADRQTPPPKNPIVFVGSSSFAYWTDVQTYFPGKAILNRGFGGSELSDALHFADRIIILYQPKQVVIYAGENDLVDNKKSATEVCHLFEQLFTKVRKALPNVAIAYVSMKPSPSRWKLVPEMQKGNRLIHRYLSRQRNAQFVDVVPVMLNPATQRPKPSIFKADSLHMNADGYKLWAAVLGPVLK